MVLRHKKPVDATPSKFVVEAVQKIKLPAHSLVLDMPCGYGRNSLFLLSKDFRVCGADYGDPMLHDGWHKSSTNILLVRLDATKRLPFAKGQFDLVVVVHFVAEGLMQNVIPCIKQGGYLIFETYSGVGGNWMVLPCVGEIQSWLMPDFEILSCKERLVGPRKENVSAKILAKKLTA